MWETWLQTRPDQNKFFEFRRSFQALLHRLKKEGLTNLLFPDELSYLFVSTNKFFHYFKNGIFTYKHIMSIQPGGNLGSLQFDDPYTRCTSIFTVTPVILCCIRRSNYAKFLEQLATAPLSLVHSKVTLIQKTQALNSPVSSKITSSPTKMRKSKSYRGIKRAISIIKREKTRVFVEKTTANFLQPQNTRRKSHFLEPGTNLNVSVNHSLVDTSNDTVTKTNGGTNSTHDFVQGAIETQLQRPKISAKARPFCFPPPNPDKKDQNKAIQKAKEQKEWLEKFSSPKNHKKDALLKRGLQKSHLAIPELKSFMDDEVISRKFQINKEDAGFSFSLRKFSGEGGVSSGEEQKLKRKINPTQLKLKVLVNRDSRREIECSSEIYEIDESIQPENYATFSKNGKPLPSSQENQVEVSNEAISTPDGVTVGSFVRAKTIKNSEYLGPIGSGPNPVALEGRNSNMALDQLSPKNPQNNETRNELIVTPSFGRRALRLQSAQMNRVFQETDNIFEKRNTYKELLIAGRKEKEEEAREIAYSSLMTKNKGHESSKSAFCLGKKEGEIQHGSLSSTNGHRSSFQITKGRPQTSMNGRADYLGIFGIHKNKRGSLDFSGKIKEKAQLQKENQLNSRPNSKKKKEPQRLIPFSKSRLVFLRQSIVQQSPDDSEQLEEKLNFPNMNQYYEPPEDYIPNNSYHKYKKMLLLRQNPE